MKLTTPLNAGIWAKFAAAALAGQNANNESTSEFMVAEAARQADALFEEWLKRT